ncbi:MAG: insulinase family protein [Methylococcaceae bacterium]|nr:insulinase family protein [Methylococcaceae bacterium]MCI0732490.1 insulinase family protein [Methylococcaceae bacterium]
MRIRIAVFCSWLSCLLAAPCVQGGPEIQHWQTDKGTRVYFVEAKGLPLVDIQFVFDAGSARDAEKFGLAALTSGLLDKGAGEWDAGQIAERLEGIGAELGTGVSQDSAWVTLRSLTDARILETALKTTAKVLTSPRFGAEDFAREQKRVLAALRRYTESPAQVVKKAFFERIYQKHPYAHQVFGEPETVQALNAREIREFYQRYYVASNAIAVVVGDVTREKAASMIEELTAELRTGTRPAAVPPVDYNAGGHRESIAFPSAQTHIYAGMPALSHNDPEFFALYVGNHVLGGNGLVSQISEEIREKRGLAYSSSSIFSPMMRKGPFIMGLQTRNDQAGEALRVLDETIKNFIAKGPNEEELAKAKNNLTGGFVLRIDSNSKVSDYVAMIAYYGLPLDYLDTFSENVDAVTADEIKEAFQSHLRLEQFQTVLVGGEAKSGGK